MIGASAGAWAAPQAFTSSGAANFTMLDPTGATVGVDNTVSGWVDYAAGTFGVSSTTPFFGMTWAASGGTLFGPGSYSISTADPAPAVSGGTYNVTVGAGQMGGHIDFAWGGTTGIDVLMVWNVVDNGNGTMTFTSVDTDADANLFNGTGMIDGPFPGFSANFNFWDCMDCDYSPPVDPEITPTIPEASTYALMLAGLGVVGVVTRRAA